MRRCILVVILSWLSAHAILAGSITVELVPVDTSDAVDFTDVLYPPDEWLAAGYLVYDLQVYMEDASWFTASSAATASDGIFWEHGMGSNAQPDVDLFGGYGLLRYDSFWTCPEEYPNPDLAPSSDATGLLSEQLVLTNTYRYAVWFMMDDDPDAVSGTYTIARYCIMPDSLSSVELCIDGEICAPPSGECSPYSLCISYNWGACCIDLEECYKMTMEDCYANFGEWHQSLSCSDVNCDPAYYGACCLPEGECIYTSWNNCKPLDGAFYSNMVCSPSPCWPGGACCFEDGSCDIMTEVDCYAVEGSYQGYGSVCEPNPCRRTVWHVDDDAPSDPSPGTPEESDPLEDGSSEHPFDAIQEGIDEAEDGDTVIVHDGTYTGLKNKDLDLGGKAITVRSASNDPALCIIDCEGAGRGFCFRSGEGADTRVEGLTVTNGDADSGGGVYCYETSPTLTNCTIRGNAASGARGGGVFCSYYSSPTLTNCTIRENSTGYAGGGVYCSGSSPTLINCMISTNSAVSDGGGVYCSFYSSPTLTNCTIRENSTGYAGGGVYCSGSSPTLINCMISTNSAVSDGGGVYCYGYNSNLALANCTINENSAYGNGGGICCDCSSCSLMLTNCSISGNSANQGGGIYCDGSSPALTNCTINENSAIIAGGGIYCFNYGSSPELTNCVLWGDTPQEIFVWLDYGNPIVTYCDVQGGTDEPWFGTGCIDADPLFAFPDDLHVMPGSPCIDSGANDPPGGLPDGDLEGKTTSTGRGRRRCRHR